MVLFFVFVAILIFLLGEPLVKPLPAPVRAPTPPLQTVPEMKFELISPVHQNTNPFRTSDVASPMLPRRVPVASGDLLDIQTTLPKAKSLVCNIICLYN